MTRGMTILAVMLTGLVMTVRPAAGQHAGGPAVVNASGRHVELYAPDTVRVRFRIFGEGKNAESAFHKVMESKEAIEKRVGKLGADGPKATYSGAEQLIDRPSNPMARMQAAMMGGKQEKPDNSLIKLSVTIDLDWG